MDVDMAPEPSGKSLGADEEGGSSEGAADGEQQREGTGEASAVPRDDAGAVRESDAPGAGEDSQAAAGKDRAGACEELSPAEAGANNLSDTQQQTLSQLTDLINISDTQPTSLTVPEFRLSQQVYSQDNLYVPSTGFDLTLLGMLSSQTTALEQASQHGSGLFGELPSSQQLPPPTDGREVPLRNREPARPLHRESSATSHLISPLVSSPPPVTAHNAPTATPSAAPASSPPLTEDKSSRAVHHSLMKPEHRHSKAARRGPMDEMRQLVRILLKLIPSSAVFLSAPEEGGGGNRVSEVQIRDFLVKTLGNAPMPEWGLPQGWGQYLAELFSWALDRRIRRDQAMKCARRQPGRSWEASEEEMTHLGVYCYNWPLPLTKAGCQAALPRALARKEGAHDAAAADGGDGGGGGGGGPSSSSRRASTDEEEREAKPAIAAPSEGMEPKRKRTKAQFPGWADFAALSELDCWHMALQCAQQAVRKAGTTPLDQVGELQATRDSVQRVLAAHQPPRGDQATHRGGSTTVQNHMGVQPPDLDPLAATATTAFPVLPLKACRDGIMQVVACAPGAHAHSMHRVGKCQGRGAMYTPAVPSAVVHSIKAEGPKRDLPGAAVRLELDTSLEALMAPEVTPNGLPEGQARTAGACLKSLLGLSRPALQLDPPARGELDPSDGSSDATQGAQARGAGGGASNGQWTHAGRPVRPLAMRVVPPAGRATEDNLRSHVKVGSQGTGFSPYTSTSPVTIMKAGGNGAPVLLADGFRTPHHSSALGALPARDSQDRGIVTDTSSTPSGALRHKLFGQIEGHLRVSGPLAHAPQGLSLLTPPTTPTHAPGAEASPAEATAPPGGHAAGAAGRQQ